MMREKVASPRSGRLILGLNVAVFAVTVLCCAIRWDALERVPGDVAPATITATARPLGVPPPKILGVVQATWVGEDTPEGHVTIYVAVTAVQNQSFWYNDATVVSVAINQSDEQITADLRAAVAEQVNQALLDFGIEGFHYTANDIRGCSP